MECVQVDSIGQYAVRLPYDSNLVMRSGTASCEP